MQIIYKIEDKIFCFFVDELPEQNLKQVFLNSILLKPLKFVLGILLAFLLFAWIFSGFGFFFIIEYFIEEKYILVFFISFFNLVMLARWIDIKIIQFRERDS